MRQSERNFQRPRNDTLVRSRSDPQVNNNNNQLLQMTHVDSLRLVRQRADSNANASFQAMTMRNLLLFGQGCVDSCDYSCDDPFQGLFNKRFLSLNKNRCLRLCLLMEHYSKDDLTQFGKCLEKVTLLKFNQEDFGAVLAEEVMTLFVYSIEESEIDDISPFLREKFQHCDEEGVAWEFNECSLCFSPCRFVRKPPCCRQSICSDCWHSYVVATANNSIALHLQGTYNLHCYSCSKLVPFNQALSCTEPEDMALIRPKLMGANESTRCPNCLEPAPPLLQRSDEIDGDKKKQQELLRNLQKQKGGHPYNCTRCGHDFCRFCGAAISTHGKLSCRQLNATDAGLQTWSKQRNNGRPEFMVILSLFFLKFSNVSVPEWASMSEMQHCRFPQWWLSSYDLSMWC